MARPRTDKRAALAVFDDALDDEAAPISEPRPSSPVPDAGMLDEAPASNDTAAPLPPDSAPTSDQAAATSDEAAATPVTRALTDAFLAKKSTLARIRQVVDDRVPPRVQKADREDMVQEACVRAASTTALAQSVPKMRPWVSRIAQNVVIDHFRADARQLKWLDRSVDVQELPPDPALSDDAELPPEDPTAPPRPVETVDERRLVTWLTTNVKTAADRLTLEMLVEKATSKKSNAAIAAEHAMTEMAFDQRLRRFKAKWIPQWKRSEERRKQNLMLMVVAFVLAAAAAIVWWVLHAPKKTEPIGPTEVPVLTAPTASGPVFDNSQPTQPRDTQPQREDGDKPGGKKR